jgi:hypothetical protein
MTAACAGAVGGNGLPSDPRRQRRLPGADPVPLRRHRTGGARRRRSQAATVLHLAAEDPEFGPADTQRLQRRVGAGRRLTVHTYLGTRRGS